MCLRAQLRQCQDRLRFLEAALRHHHTHAHHILTGEKVEGEQFPLASVGEEKNLHSMILKMRTAVCVNGALSQHTALLYSLMLL